MGDYATIRDAIEMTYPETFKDFNKRLFQPGGFPRPLPARERKWVTSSGKANFITPERLQPEMAIQGETDSVLLLASLRSNDQFNTTVYGYTDRFRGVKGTRLVVFVSRTDLERLGLAEGDAVDLTTALAGPERVVRGLRVVEYDIPAGSCGAYYPEVNPLFPLSHHDAKSKTPAYKALPVRVTRAAAMAAD